MTFVRYPFAKEFDEREEEWDAEDIAAHLDGLAVPAEYAPDERTRLPWPFAAVGILAMALVLWVFIVGVFLL